jgi:sulfonate transport system substrate-binding protein
VDQARRGRRSGRPAGCFTAGAVVVVSLLLGALPAQASRHAAGDKKQLDLSDVTIRVGYSAVRDNSTQDVRLASGAFDHTPYNIKWAVFTGSTAALEAMNAGAIDLTPETMALNVILAQAGAKTPWTRATALFTIVAASEAPPASGAVIGVHPDSGINSVKDLKGKKVSYVRGGVSQLWWTIAAKDAKLKKGDVQVVELPVADGRAAFLSGAVDALVGQHRTFIPLESSGQARVIAKSNGAAPEYRTTLVRNGYLDDKKQAAAVDDFVKRLNRSKRWLDTHQKEAALVYQKSASVEPADAKAAVAEFPTQILALDDELAKKLQNQSQIFFDDGVTTANPKVSILFDKRYDATGHASTG